MRKFNVDTKVSELTDGMVPRASNAAALARWLVDRGIELKSGVAKSVVEELLARESLDDLARRVLEVRRDGGGSSSRK